MSKTDDIEHALRMLNAAFAKGAISEADYETRDTRLRARQAEIKAWRDGTAPQPRLPLLAPPRRPLRADLDGRVIRRRSLAYGGMIPPQIAKTFTIGQAAVLTVV